MKKLETEMPNYSQTVADLQESVVFEKISLVSANGKLSVQARSMMTDVCAFSDIATQSVTSEVGVFSLLNGNIDGHFNARSSLDLRIANGRISPTVNLLHREGADPSNVTIHVINGYAIFVPCLHSWRLNLDLARSTQRSRSPRKRRRVASSRSQRIRSTGKSN